MKKFKKAISAIEMAVVITITGLIASTAVVSFNYLSRYQLQAETQKLVSELERTRELATATHHNYIFYFNYDWTRNLTDQDELFGVIRSDDLGVLNLEEQVLKKPLGVDGVLVYNTGSARALHYLRFVFSDTEPEWGTSAGGPEFGRMVRGSYLGFYYPPADWFQFDDADDPILIFLWYRNRMTEIEVSQETANVSWRNCDAGNDCCSTFDAIIDCP